MSRLVSLGEAAAAIPDGALLTLGGFDIQRAPMALLRELVRQRRRGLRLIGPPNPLAHDLLVGAGAAESVDFGFLGFQYEGGFVVAPNLRRAIERGAVRWHERDVYEIVQSLRASAFGLPFLAAPGDEGSDYLRVNATPRVTGPDGGAPVPVARAVRPDVAILHAQEADRSGNLRIDDPYAEALQAAASRSVIASAERIVERVELPTVPGDRVDLVVEAPRGAFPTSCHLRYPHAAGHLAAYVALAGEDRFAGYLKHYLFETDGEAGFLKLAEADKAPATPPAAAERHAAIDRLVVLLARTVEDGAVVTTGVASALPMLAIGLARATRAPRATYINCVGAIDPGGPAASFNSVDVRLLQGCRARIALPDLFDLARQGRIDQMFFGAAQIDRAGRMNLTCLGDYARPTVKLPGPAGSSAMRPYVRKVVGLLPRQAARSLVERVDFATSTAATGNRETLVVTDLALLRLEAGALRTVTRHAGVTVEALRAASGFPIEAGGGTTEEPTAAELQALRKLDPDGIRYRLA